MIEVSLSIKIDFKKEDYQKIKQIEIKENGDHLVIGIYKPDIFKQDFYIVACNRIEGGRTLDYTRFAASEDQADKMLIDLFNEVKKDLYR